MADRRDEWFGWARLENCYSFLLVGVIVAHVVTATMIFVLASCQ